MSTYRKILLVATVLVVTGCQSSNGVPTVAPPVTGRSLLAPVAAGQTVVVLNGYNNPGPGLYCPSPGVNEHDHCNNQADGFDIVPSDLADTRILAPTDGTVEWVEGGCVGLRPSATNVNLTVCHFEQSSVYVQAQDVVTQGVVLGLRDPADPWVHLSIDARYTPGGGQVSPLSAARPVAFAGAYALERHDFPASQPGVPNEWACATLTSTNVPTGDHAARPNPPSMYAQAPAMDCPTTGGQPTSAAVADCGPLRSGAADLTPGSDPYRSNVEAQVAAGCLVYMSSASSLYLVDTASGTDVKVGDYGQVGDMFDIALAPDGTMYGLASGGNELVRIDRWTAATTDIGPTNDTMNGLTVMANGTMYGSGGTDLFAIDPQSGATTHIGSTGFESSGDLTPDGAGSLLLAATYLVRVNPADGTAQAIGTARFDNVYGLTMTATGLYGGTDDGELLRIDASTGTYQVIASGLPAWNGMG